jgi:hypothetical protein
MANAALEIRTAQLTDIKNRNVQILLKRTM